MKVFLSPVRRGYYNGNPTTGFKVEMSYAVCLPANGDVNPDTEEGVMVLLVNEDLSDMYAKAWEELQELCVSNNWGTPQKQNVFLYTNTTLDQVLP